MPAALLETKLYVPRLRHGVVPRRRLSERLDRGTASTLTLVSAPAGFGKTTLLTEWLAESLAVRPAAPGDERLAAWLSLDRADNDPVSFWTYVIAAPRTVASGVGEGALACLQAPQPPPAETVLTILLNDLGAIAADIVLVLDDYHVIDAREVQDGMAFLLDHQPPRLHVVIVSRADPALPLARLRARGELAEIRAAELRFTPDEAAAYFNETMGLQLTAPDVAALEGRAEGWIAALQLAALSLQGRDDVAGFIAGFAGDDRYVVDYQHEDDQASRLLERLLLAAEEGQRTGRVIEILVLRALAQQALGDIPAALAALERALALAEPEGYVRVFADEGPPMTALLRTAAKAGIRRDYARRLLAAVRGPEDDGPLQQALVDPLSERELDVLRLLGTELNGPAIARELVVSLNTVRTHTKSIYAKLGVTSRGAAVRQAAELGLLPRAGDRRQP